MVEVSSRWFIDQEEPESGDLVATIPVTRRFDLTDGHWAVLEPLLPQPKRSGRPSLWSKRQLIDGSGGGSGSVRPGGTCRRSTAAGRRRTHCLGGGSGMAPGNGC